MREIKFRAFSKKHKKMIYFDDGVSIDLNDKREFTSLIIGFKLGEHAVDETLYSNDFELMQFTGLKDKNGKEIYEGDIVKFGAVMMQLNEQIVGLIVYNDLGAAFSIKTGNIERPIWSIAEGIKEIIGNIYENPELLERKEC